jgi:hypothetical protein
MTLSEQDSRKISSLQGVILGTMKTLSFSSENLPKEEMIKLYDLIIEKAQATKQLLLVSEAWKK